MSDQRDNQMRMFEAMDEEMHILAHSSDDDNNNKEKSEEIAHALLAYAELPLGIRCRALLILGTSDGPGYVEWAKEAVRIAELGMSLPGSAPPTAGDHQLLANCKHVLKEAEEDFIKYGGYPDEEDDLEEEVEEPGEGEVDNKAAAESEGAEEGQASEGVEETQAVEKTGSVAGAADLGGEKGGKEGKGVTGMPKGKKGWRRMDSTRGMWMEWDAKKKIWFDVGMDGELTMRKEDWYIEK